MKHKKLRRYNKKNQVFQDNSTKRLTKIKEWQNRVNKHNALLESIIHSICCCESAGYKKFASFHKLMEYIVLLLENGISKKNMHIITEPLSELMNLMENKHIAGYFFTYTVSVYLVHLAEMLNDINNGNDDKILSCDTDEYPFLRYYSHPVEFENIKKIL